MHDLKLVYTCETQYLSNWQVESSYDSVFYNSDQHKVMKTDPATCLPVNASEMNITAQGVAGAVNQTLVDSINATVNDIKSNLVWERVQFTLLSMLVSAGFFASLNITTFYTTMTVVVGGQFRIAMIYYFFMAFQYETTHPDVIIKLIEAVYMKRHELDLIGEEECYRML